MIEVRGQSYAAEPRHEELPFNDCKAIKNLLVHRIVSSRLFLMTMVKCI